MKVNTTTFTIAEYCKQMDVADITVNHDYQRSPKRWPTAARSFLIDTILNGYPIPKLSLHQKTDLLSRKTTKEIVDGQQRSVAILDFYKNKLRLTGSSRFSGRTYGQLEIDEKQAFLEYALSVDIFSGATDPEIREVFRRINSYTVPLNRQEQRHAVYQGLFKWFILEQTARYAEVLKKIGVFREQQLSQMADGAILTEFCRTVVDGIATANETKLDSFYGAREESFPEKDEFAKRLHELFAIVVELDEVHNGPIMKAFSFLTLALAISHTLDPVSSLVGHYQPAQAGHIDVDGALSHLVTLATALDSGDIVGPNAEFVRACSGATNTENNRKIRFVWFCRALENALSE